MSAESDAELLQRWRAGDASAGEELVARHFVSVYRFFAAHIRGDLDDLTQRTFEACIVGRDRIRDDSAFRSYLFGIARKRLASRLGEQPTQQVRIPLSEAELEHLQSSPSKAFARADQQRLLLQAVAELPDDVRRVVEMFYLESEKMTAIADGLGVPLGTIKSRLFRGRALLRAAFERNEVDDALKTQTVAALEDASRELDDDDPG